MHILKLDAELPFLQMDPYNAHTITFVVSFYATVPPNI